MRTTHFEVKVMFVPLWQACLTYWERSRRRERFSAPPTPSFTSPSTTARSWDWWVSNINDIITSTSSVYLLNKRFYVMFSTFSLPDCWPYMYYVWRIQNYSSFGVTTRSLKITNCFLILINPLVKYCFQLPFYNVSQWLHVTCNVIGKCPCNL